MTTPPSWRWHGIYGWTGTPCGGDEAGGDAPDNSPRSAQRYQDVGRRRAHPATGDNEARLHARLLDVVPERSGTAYAGWLRQQAEEFVASIKHAVLDPFRGYANAIRDELPDAVAVLDDLVEDWCGAARRRVAHASPSRGWTCCTRSGPPTQM